MLPAARITHQMPGRLRVRIPAKRRDDTYFAHLHDRLRQCEGVASVSINALSASVLVIGDMASETLTTFAERNGLFSIGSNGRERATAGPLSRQVTAQVDRWDEQLRTFTSGRLDVSSCAMLGLTIGALWQMSRRRILPEALTVLWYAANVAPGSVRPRFGP